MTIIAGFRCQDGIVVCADTQETMGDAKKNVQKLQFHSGPFYDDEKQAMINADLAVAFAGAGHGPFVDKIVGRAWNSVRAVSDIWEAADAIEAVIKSTYEEFGSIYQTGNCPHAELVYGIKMGCHSRLFHAYGPIVNEKDYVSSGIGYYLADFLSGRMYGAHLTTRQCVILAAYILYQTKEHVEGCGGESQIVVLRNAEPSGNVECKLVDEVTEFLKLADKELGELLLSSANFSEPNELVDKQFGETLETVRLFRDHHKGELEKHRKWWNENSFLGITIECDDLGIAISTDVPQADQLPDEQH